MLTDAFNNLGAWQELEKRGRPVTPHAPLLLDAESGLLPIQPLGAAAAANAVIEVYASEHLIENSREVGAYLYQRAGELMERHPSLRHLSFS